LWTGALSDRDLDAGGVAGWQTPQGWDERRRCLLALGGPPTTPEDVLAWHRRQARVCMRDWYWSAAAWHLDRLIEAGPPQSQLRLDRGLAHAELREEDQANADFARANELRPGGVPLVGIHRLEKRGVFYPTSVAFSPDSRRVLFGAPDNSLHLWDAQ